MGYLLIGLFVYSFGDELIRQEEYINNCKPTLIVVVKQIKNITVMSLTAVKRGAYLALKSALAELELQPQSRSFNLAFAA